MRRLEADSQAAFPGQSSQARTKGNAHFQIGNKMPGDHDRYRDGGDVARVERDGTAAATAGS